MATSADTVYGSPTTVTITLASLADGSSRESAEFFAALHNGALLDAQLDVDINGQASGTGLVSIYAYARSADAASYTDNATGADAAFTTANIKNAVLIGTVQMDAANAQKAGPFSIASAFGGFVPKAGGIIVHNDSGAALAASGITIRATPVRVDA